MQGIQITPQFKDALEALDKAKDSVFITGKAGSGKSTLLQYFLQHTSKTIVVLAPTGVAALNIGGTTIHSFFGFPPSISIEKAKKLGKKNQREIYKKVEMIIIDEISMVRADLLDCVDLFLQQARKTSEPFGGVRMAFIGDLYQLPPVIAKSEKEWFTDLYESPYFFSSSVMQRAKESFQLIELEQIFRQTDSQFIELLNAIRNRSIEDSQIARLNQRVGVEVDDEGFIYLTGTNKSADSINHSKLEAIPRPAKKFYAEIEGDFEDQAFPAPKELELKEGAQVMFLTNCFPLWVNGTIGKIQSVTEAEVSVSLEDNSIVTVTEHTWELFEYTYDSSKKDLKRKKKGSFTQLPLRLAWALTIHKSQGKTFDRVIVEINRIFAHGQLYVALSRCRSFEGLVLKTPVKKGHIRLDYTIMQFLTQFQYAQSEKRCSMEEKIALIDQAIEKNQSLEISYLKTNDKKSKRIIKPLERGNFQFKNRSFQGILAYCMKRQEERNFRIDRILSIQCKE